MPTATGNPVVDALVADAREILTRAENEARDLTEDEATRHDQIVGRASALLDLDKRTSELEAAVNPRMRELLASPDGDPPARTTTLLDGEPLGERRMVDYVRDHRIVDDEATPDLSLRKALRGVVTGDWNGADAERRAMNEGTAATGGYLVPTILAAQLVDLARNQARVMQAGARIVPMPNKTVTVPKWVGDQTAAWHTEGAIITPTDATIGAVTLTARSLASLTVVSRELLEDAPGVEEELRVAFANQFALTVDLAALYGTGTAPEPRGVKNTPGVQTRSLGANGAAPTNYDMLVDAVGDLADRNEQATAIIYAPRTARELAKLKATDGQPLTLPDYVANIPRYDTNQVPVTLTAGTSTDSSDMFTADWRQLYLGVRTTVQVEVLREKYADTGQVGFLAWWRGDIAVARPAAFHVTTGIR